MRDAPSPLPETLRLITGRQHLDIAPLAGGAIAQCFELERGKAFHWLRPADAVAVRARDPDRMASFPLIPFCNRIRDGRFRSGDLTVQLPPAPNGAVHSIHGTVRHLPWQVGRHDGHTALLYVDHARGAWPWHFAATQHFQLDAEALHVTLSVTNLDERPMPIGLGHHPYLPHRPGTRLRASLDAMWSSDADLLPTELTRPPFLRALAQGVELATLDLDNNFIGWDRRARVDWPQQRRALSLVAETPLDYFVLYCPRGRDHFCIEAVSNCTDWLNLRDAAPPASIGGAMLAPGGHYEARFSLLFERL